MAPDKLDVSQLAKDFELRGREHGWEAGQLSPIGRFQRPWLHLPAGPGAKRLYLSSGVHGDEPAPPLALRELVETPEVFRGLEVFLFPLINPEGLAVGSRGNRNNIDCNRDYLNPQTNEVRGHVEVLQRLPRFDLALCLHEDWEASGVYLYALAGPDAPDLSQPLLQAMARHMPVETATHIDESEALNGVIAKTDITTLMESPDWPEAFYLTRHHVASNYTLETPSSLNLRLRVSAHVEAVKTAARHFADLPA